MPNSGFHSTDSVEGTIVRTIWGDSVRLNALDLQSRDTALSIGEEDTDTLKLSVPKPNPFSHYPVLGRSQEILPLG